MQFHHYVTYRKLVARNRTGAERDVARGVSSHEYRKMVLTDLAMHGSDAALFNEHTAALAEEAWVDLERPYYNVWPIATELVQSVKLDLKFSQIQIPFDAILLRFAVGQEPSRLGTVLLFWSDDSYVIKVCCHFQDGTDNLLHIQHTYNPDDIVEDWLHGLTASNHGLERHHSEASALIVRLIVFLSLLSKSDDLITPIVLSKDQSRYNANDDEAEKEWLENRAAKRAGRGFDFGKRLQIQSEQSPHWRNPHLCLFWTGKGRTAPTIKMRSGAVVQKVSMAEVPTGYLGPETALEDQIAEKTLRVPLSKSKRFEILRRDNYKCQLCGATQGTGAVLHVDHKIPLASGGTYYDENLWTLCEDCNLGKSAREL